MSGHLVQNPKKVLGSMRWFAHSVPLLNGNGTMVMEAQSRYCMVFHNLIAKDFDHFPELFADRLFREVIALCQLSGINNTRLGQLVKQSCTDFQFSLGLDYSISADVYDAARHLQTIVEDLGGYPVVGVTEFGLGIKLNQEPLPHLSDNKPTSALDAFRAFWMQTLETAASETTITGVNKHWPDNVVELPNRKK